MIAYFEELLISLITSLPLEGFAFIASFVEEIIAPIPSPAIMIAAGSFAKLQGLELSSLILLSIIAAFGKTIGALVLYFITGKIGELILKKFGGFFNVTLESVSDFGKKLGRGWRDYTLLIILRTLPFVPSSLVSVGCGFLKVPLRLFIVTTFFGSILRGGMYLYFGYMGTEVLGAFIKKSASLESFIELFALIGIAGVLGFVYLKRRKN